MLNIDKLTNIANNNDIPVEDALFMAINFSGVHMDVSYNRMRTAFHLDEKNPAFSLANERDDLNYYLALPINHQSPFSISKDKMYFAGMPIGDSIGATEDFCDSHYPRRLGTSLNINPNSRTSCRGCDFCYTAYQIPLDKKKMRTCEDLVKFFDEWIHQENKKDLSHLIQVSIVTGCYDSEESLVDFIILLSEVLKGYGFKGRIFYLGSMLTSIAQMERLNALNSFGYCMSVECFAHRDVLAPSKRKFTLADIKRTLSNAKKYGFEVNYTYVLGLEPLETMKRHMTELLEVTNKFPTVNILQLHQQHDKSLLDPSFDGIQSLIQARKIIESIYQETSMRPLVWEDYRTLWYLKFAKEDLTGIRFPSYFWEDKVEK